MGRDWMVVTVGLAVLGATLGACSSNSGTGGGGGIAPTTTSSTTHTTTHTGSGGTGGGGMGAMGGGAAGGQGGGQGGAGGSASVNGCTLADATDMTSHDVVDLTWSLPHHECTLVAAGTTVTWSGNFGAHPLVGGVTPTTDPASPITTTAPVGNQESVVFSQAGEYPYFCTVHFASMQGVIYVQ